MCNTENRNVIKRCTRGPGENFPSAPQAEFIQSMRPTAALSEAILHKPNKPTGCPALGLGLDLTNWITAQSSFYNAKQAADKDNRQQSSSQIDSWDLISLLFYLNQICATFKRTPFDSGPGTCHFPPKSSVYLCNFQRI